jgi:hypothetical protein
MHPLDRLRQQLAEEYAPALAERMYQIDKGSRYARLSDLLTDSSRQAYLDAALAALTGPAQKVRIQSVQAAIAQHHATQAHESETLTREARADIAKFGNGSIN